MAAIVVAIVLAWARHGPAAAIEGIETPASDLRVTLDRILSEHVFLTVQALEAGLTDDDQFAAAAAALEANTSELETAISGIYNTDAGQRFGDLWRAHIGYVVDYTRARHAGDDGAAQAAADGLEAYQADFAAFLADANPHLPAETLHHLLEDHLAQLRQVGDLQTGDYRGVYALARDAYGHMFTLGDSLALAIAQQFPDRYPGRATAFGPAFDLQITLDRLLGEHAFFAVEVVRLAAGDPMHQQAASEALASNGDALRAAVTELYGEEAGRGFAAVWEDHNGNYVDYVRARLAGDEAGAEDARARLETFSGRAADFFTSANEMLDASALRSGLAVHTQHLLEQVDAHVAGDYGRSYAIGRDAHQHMAAISNALATGIAKQFPERFLPDTALRPPASDLARIGVLTMGAVAAIGAALAAATAWRDAERPARAMPAAAGGSRSASRSAGRAKAR